MTRQNNRTAEDVFFQPMLYAIEQSKTRACGKITDEIHILSGTLRALEKADSGREWDRSDSRNNGVIFERLLKSLEGIADEKSLRRARQRLDKQMAKAKASGKAFNSLVSGCLRATKRSLQFLRWLRVLPAAEKLLERLYRNPQASYD